MKIIALLSAALFGLANAVSIPQKLPLPLSTATTMAFLNTPYYGSVAITQGFHAEHSGVDFRMRYDRVLAAADGIVNVVAWYSTSCHNDDDNNPDDNYVCSYGLYVRIDHDNGYRTIYGHLSATAFPLGTTGVRVSQGQVIGTSGDTGWSSGPHLHFEVRRPDSSKANPFDDNGLSLWATGEWASPSNPLKEPPVLASTTWDDLNGAPGSIACDSYNCSD